MTTIQFRRALIGFALAAGIFCLAVPPALAGHGAPPDPEPAAAAPKCGSGAGLMHATIASAHTVANSTSNRNFVSIQRVSPINGTPFVLSNNGFTKLCQRLDAPGGSAFDVNSDGVSDTARLIQFDPHDGRVHSHECNDTTPDAAQPWDAAQGVEIQIFLGGGLPAQEISLLLPGVECTQEFAAYKNSSPASAKGNIFFPMPLSSTCTDRNCICDQLNLPDNTIVRTIRAEAGPPVVGNVETHTCKTPREGDDDPPLRVGESALIIGEAGILVSPFTEGNPLNCLTLGPACPLTPSGDYPAPLIY